MPQSPIVQRIIELLKRYPGIIALGGFLSGIGSFILVDRQPAWPAGSPSHAGQLGLADAGKHPHRLFARTFKREIPQPLLRYATQMIHQETCSSSCRSSSSPPPGTAASWSSPACSAPPA
jgi:hypothetical protein